MSKQRNGTKDPIWDLLRKVTIPASVGSLFQTFYNLVDTWCAGIISAEAIGAIAKSFPIYFYLNSFWNICFDPLFLARFICFCLILNLDF